MIKVTIEGKPGSGKGLFLALIKNAIRDNEEPLLDFKLLSTDSKQRSENGNEKLIVFLETN